MTSRRVIHVVSLVAALGAGTSLVVAAQQTPSSAPAQPQITLAPGLREVPDYRKTVVEPPAPRVPDGFTPIFNGKDLAGWHVSKAARHGLTPDFHVAHGMILGTQRPLGSGGLLITDKKYRDFEFYMEVKPDWGDDSGVFFRTTESGAAYQITMDYLPGGSMGRLISEGGIAFGAGRATAAGGTAPAGAAVAQPVARGTQVPDPGMAAWKREDWNTVRIRVVGNVPHATVWINDAQVSDASDTENHAVGGMIDGPIAIQIHGGGVRWQPGGFWRWRNLAIKELPR
jgi:3-keto-disaccharide hydrolase